MRFLIFAALTGLSLSYMRNLLQLITTEIVICASHHRIKLGKRVVSSSVLTMDLIPGTQNSRHPWSLSKANYLFIWVPANTLVQ